MSTLATLHWKKYARVSVALTANAPAESLDAMWTRLDPAASGFYYDGITVRTPGVTGPTWSRYQNAGPTTTEALYSSAFPAGGVGVCIAGQDQVANPVKSPTRRTPDTTNSANILIANVAANAGAFASWDAAAVFGASARHFNYWKWATMGIATTVNFDMYECEEAFAVAAFAAGAPVGLLIGAIYDQHSQLGADAEVGGASAGRVMGMVTGNASIATNFLSTSDVLNGNNVGQFMDHHTTEGQNHNGILIPGQTGIRVADKYGNTAYDGNTFRTLGGINVMQTGYPFFESQGSLLLGTSRQSGPCPQTTLGAVFQSGGVDVAYTAFSGSHISAQQAWALAA
jgi:hypothetical protein